jgi:hypothetical protein
MDGACWHKWFDNGWSGWESLGGQFQSGISAASWGASRLDLFGQGMDGACWHKWFDNGWSDWESLGGGFTSGIGSVSWGPGRLDLFGRGTDSACWHAWYDGGWSSWDAPEKPTASLGDLTIPVWQVIHLEAMSLPTFDPAESAKLLADPKTTVTVKGGGAQWATLPGWLAPPADGRTATVLCRKTGLSIRLAATGAAGVSVLPFEPGMPAAELVYTTGSGATRQQKSVPMETAVDTANRVLMLLLPFADLATYGDMVDVLTDSASEVKVVVSTTHRYQVSAGAVLPEIIERPPITLPRIPITRDHRFRQTLLGLPGLLPRVPVDDALRRPAVFEAIRLSGRDWRRVVWEPPERAPGSDVTQATVATAFEFPVFRPRSDLTVYPDLPRVEQGGWGQVPGRSADLPPLHFKDSPRPDVFFTLPTHFKLGFFRGADPGGADDLAPLRVTQYLDDQGGYRVAVSLVAIPFMSDADREALSTHIREVVLQQMLPFVSLEPRAGLTARFVSQFSAGGGEDHQVLPESIKFTAEEVLADRRLSLRFDMEAMHYGIFCELLRKGIRGRVTLTDEGVQESIDVQLRLDDMVANGVTIETDGFGVGPAPAPGPAEPAQPAPKRSLTVRNELPHPARVSSVRVTCVDRGRVPGMVFDAERLDLVAAEQTLAPSTTASFEVKPQRIAVWNDTVVSVGTVRVDAGTPQEWLDRVTNDPSLQPQRHGVKVVPVAAAGAALKLVRLKLFKEGDPAERLSQDILPTGPADLMIELTLAELAAAGTKPPTFLLEYDCVYLDDRISLPQRLALSPTVREMPISVLVESPDSVFRLEHNAADAPTVTVDNLARDAAVSMIDELRTRGERWRVFARKG